MKIMYLHKVWIFEIYISLFVPADLSAAERKLSKQFLIGRTRTNPDLGFNWARLLQFLQ